jgi:uncharacterized coiled-coil DUF342 family protein
MSLADTELSIGGVKLKGIYIAVVFSLATTIGSFIWAASSLYGRLEAVESIVVPDVTPIEENIKLIQQQLVDNDISQLSAKLATLGTTLVTMTESHKNLLELQSDVSELSKEIEAMKSVVKQAELVTEALSEYKDEYKGIKREIEDLWMGLDHLSDPLR